MESRDGRCRAILQNFQKRLSEEELEVFSRTTLKDVHDSVRSIQARQEADRTMMNLTRLGVFLDRTNVLTSTLRAFDEDTNYMAFAWGPLKATLHLTSQDQKAFDILLDAYDRIGDAIPDLQGFHSIFASHPGLRKILELIYQDVLEFQESVLRLSTHPNMRTLFRSMWNDYKQQFEAKLNSLEELQNLTKSIVRSDDTSTSAALQGTTIVNFYAGSYHERTELHGNSVVHQGDVINDAAASETLEKFEQSQEEIRHLLENQMKDSHGERFVKIREWIAGSPPYQDHDRVCEERRGYPNTGTWILDNHLVAAWMKDDLPQKPLLWIHGIPGAGKTVLASILIDACEKIENSHTAYFYCNYNNPETNTTIAILKGLLRQAIFWRPELMSYFDEQRRQGGETTICREQTARRLTNVIFHDGGQTYLVIDGIDECSLTDRKSILSILSSLVHEVDQKNPGKLRLTVISQNEPDIKRALINAAELQIDKNMNGGDIKLYVEHWTGRIARKFGLEQHEVQALQTETRRYAAGQFLYAKLVMKNLFDQVNLLELREAMQDSEFPRELSGAYEKIMKRMREHLSSPEWKVTQQLLGWMTCAARPLKWREMQGALSIDFDNLTVDFKSRALCTHVQDLCGALVSVHDDRISLVHRTAQEFITRSEYIDNPSVECQLANLCIRYLELPCFDINSTPEDLRYYLVQGHFAFADYAAAKWMHHLYRVVEQAEALADGSKWDAREDDVNELLETMQYFAENHQDDFRESQKQAGLRNIDTRLDPVVGSLLDRCSVENGELSFQQLWVHAKLIHTGDFHTRQMITPQNLRSAIEQMRLSLEDEFCSKTLARSEREIMETYYGEKVFRCSKTSCFYFHQGFGDLTSRNKHVAKHERPFECLEPDCAKNGFSFGDKKALEAHIVDVHPDSESKAALFGKKEVKQKVTKYRCELCDQHFARNGILQAHQRSHAGQKPFECSKCGKAFVRKWDCTRHEKSHENRIRG